MVCDLLFGVQNLAASRSLLRSTKALADATRCSLATMNYASAAVVVNLIGTRLNPHGPQSA